MCCGKVLTVIIIVFLNYDKFALTLNICGIANSNTSIVVEGLVDINTYPWLGVLYYPMGYDNEILTTTVVLITTRMAMAAALDIDRYPKSDFRAKARVVLGSNCTAPFAKIADYSYHPDFTRNTYSSIAIVQLETSPVWSRLKFRYICPPPKLLKNADIYAMTLNEDCMNSTMVRVYKMKYVDPKECKEFYRRTELDVESLWPTHVACARALRDGHCVWRSGTVLAVRDVDQWRLLGFGVNGPGCESPARFLDYGMYYSWVKQSLSRIGRPAITRIGPGELILRRSLVRLQRYGDCDEEEVQAELYNDFTAIGPMPDEHQNNLHKVTLNMSLLVNVDYSCMKIKVYGDGKSSTAPYIKLRRWCTHPTPPCYDFNIIQINFVTEIYFSSQVFYELKAYGKEIKTVDSYAYRMYAYKIYFNQNATMPNYFKGDTKFSHSTPVPDVLHMKKKKT